MKRGFDARELEHRYGVLDRLPSALYEAVVIHTHGILLERARGILEWRRALLRGELPHEEVIWPQDPYREDLLRELGALNVARFCKGAPELADTLLQSVLDVVGGADRAWHDSLARELEELKALELERRRTLAAGSEGKDSPTQPLDQAALNLLSAEAERRATAKSRKELAAGLRARWGDLARMWAEIAEVFGELGGLLGRGWDLCRGILSSQGWLEIARLRKLIERLGPLRELVRTLGRLQFAENGVSVVERIFTQVKRATDERIREWSPLAPVEARGVERSGDVARMLPAEAALLVHRRLRLLWHARRAERALATYRVEGLLTDEARPGLEEGSVESQSPAPPRERGPILLCLDTSGSMHGTPERVAKALVLEAMRVAHTERRACHLYAFSGPGQVKEHTLDLSEEGLGSLLAFLGLSFHGGTDVEAPLRRVMSRLKDNSWSRADLLLISDGEFPVSDELASMVRKARTESGWRAHGILIGGANREGMEAVCDHLHRFSDWSSIEGA